MSETTITRDLGGYSAHDEDAHRWTMTIDGEIVARLWVHIATGEIANVETAQAHRGNGYASALYRQAATEIEIFHADEAHRTPEGGRFARSVGGPTLECTRECCTYEPDFD